MKAKAEGRSEVNRREEPVEYPMWYPWFLRGEADPFFLRGESKEVCADPSEPKLVVRLRMAVPFSEPEDASPSWSVSQSAWSPWRRRPMHS